MSLVAAVDESLRGKTYIVAAAVYDGADRRRIDSMVRAGRRPEQHRIHFKAESESRRRGLLASWTASGLVRSWIYVAPFPGRTARDACFFALAQDVVKQRVGRLVIELGDPIRNQRDVRVIQPHFHAHNAEVAYSHEPPGSVPGLELADGFAWAYGAGGSWRRMIAGILDVEMDTRS